MSRRRKPVEYPTRKYKQGEAELRKTLRALYRKVFRGHMTREEALERGIRALQSHYYKLIDELNKWCRRQNFKSRLSGREETLRENLTKAEAEWRGIIADM